MKSEANFSRIFKLFLSNKIPFLEIPFLNGLFDIISGEKTSDPLHNALPPAVVVLLHDVDDLSLGEGQLVLLVGVVVINCDNLGNKIMVKIGNCLRILIKSFLLLVPISIKIVG